MLTSTFMIGFSILMTYALAIGACMAILQSEFLKKGYIWFYRILIALNVIGITVFIASTRVRESQHGHNKRPVPSWA